MKYQVLMVATISIVSLNCFSAHESVSNLLQLNLIVGSEIAESEKDALRSTKIEKVKFAYDSVRFEYQNRPVLVMWKLIEDSLEIRINGERLDKATINSDNLFSKKLNQILGTQLANRFSLLDLLVPKAFAACRRCQRSGLLSFFRSLIRRISSQRNRSNMRTVQQNGFRNRNNCPYLNNDNDQDSPTIRIEDPGSRFTGVDTPNEGPTAIDNDIDDDGLPSNGVDYVESGVESDGFTVQQPRQIRYVFRTSY